MMIATSCSTIHLQAIEYLEHGISIIPLKGKKPLIQWTEFQTRHASIEEVDQWFAQWPEANIGIVTGEISGIVVVDFDTNEAFGEAQLKDLPDSPTVKTSRGYHRYFKWEYKISNFQKRDDLPDVDLRGDGGYVVAPCSVHESGHIYQWVDGLGLDSPLAPMPSWIVATTPAKKTPLKKLYNGSSNGSRNNDLTRMVGSWVRDGLSREECIESALIFNRKSNPPIDDKEIHSVVDSIIRKHETVQDPGFTINVATLIQVNANEDEAPTASITAVQNRLGITRTPQGLVVCNVNNALKVLEGCEGIKEEIWHDEFSHKIFTNWKTGIVREWSEDETIELQVFLQRYVGLSRLSKKDIYDAVLCHANRCKRNEPKDWMETLVWDGVPRTGSFLIDCAGAEDNEYTRSASNNFWVSIAARIYSPGCQMRTMVILEGAQDSGKSKLLSTIGGKWYCDCQEDIHSKDFFMVLHGMIIVEIGELSSFRKAEMTTIKQRVSCQVDRFRTPYDKSPKNHPRQGVFVGSTNDEHYFNDNTGATRFWPVKTSAINIDRAKQDRDQLFAEAVHLYKTGASWWHMPKETRDEQEQRRQVDPWEITIQSFIQVRSEVTTSEILNECMGIPAKDQTKVHEMRAGGILRLFGWKRKKKRFGKYSKWVYEPITSEAGTAGTQVGTEF